MKPLKWYVARMFRPKHIAFSVMIGPAIASPQFLEREGFAFWVPVIILIVIISRVMNGLTWKDELPP